MSKNKEDTYKLPKDTDTEINPKVKQLIRDAVKKVWDERNKQKPSK